MPRLVPKLPTVEKGRKYFRKNHVADRYSVTARTIERWSRNGRLPKPVYLPGSSFPLWREDALDAFDKLATAEPP